MVLNELPEAVDPLLRYHIANVALDECNYALARHSLGKSSICLYRTADAHCRYCRTLCVVGPYQSSLLYNARSRSPTDWGRNLSQTAAEALPTFRLDVRFPILLKLLPFH